MVNASEFGWQRSFDAAVDTSPSRFKPTFFHCPLLPSPKMSFVAAKVVPSPGRQVSAPPLPVVLVVEVVVVVVVVLPSCPPVPVAVVPPPLPVVFPPPPQ